MFESDTSHAATSILHSEWILRFRDISFSPTTMECMPPGNSPMEPCTLSFSISLPMVMYSWGSTTPLGWVEKKVMTSSKARLASSCDGGATGEEMLLLLGDEEFVAGWGGGAISVGLLLGFGVLEILPAWEAWCSASLDVRGGSDSSSTGVCKTGEAMICWMFIGVVASPESLLVAKVCSSPSMGKVWLRGLMLLALAADEIILDCWVER